MIRDDVITLISEDPGAHGVFETPADTEKTVLCQVKSVSRSEFWRAYSVGVEPELVFIIAEADADYAGEKICEYHGQRYRIVRTYCDGRSIELTVQREVP